MHVENNWAYQFPLYLAVFLKVHPDTSCLPLLIRIIDVLAMIRMGLYGMNQSLKCTIILLQNFCIKIF